jgi:putative hemolysin
MPDLEHTWPPAATRRHDPRDHTPDLDRVLRRYRVRFARCDADRDAVFRLRFEVFNLELGEGLTESFATGADRDVFDEQCQHLLVIDQRTADVIGTYRLQVAESARDGAGFYSAGEFDLAGLPFEVLDDAIELGRACVRADHRNRHVLFLLWCGLASYVLWNEKRYFFGCSSLTSTDPDEGARAYERLRRDGHVHPGFLVRPLPGRECRLGAPGALGRPITIPRLFRTYLRYGARVLGPPALDPEFKTVDFLTLLDVAAMDPRQFALFAG